MQYEYDDHKLFQEAQWRFLKPVELYFLLKNHGRYLITPEAPQFPTSGSLFLFNKKNLKNFRKDGLEWQTKRNKRAIIEGHERLKVNGVDVLNCYYAHGIGANRLQRRSYWMLDPEYDHIVLVHYLDRSASIEGKQSGLIALISSPIPAAVYSSPTPTIPSTAFRQPLSSSGSLGWHSEPPMFMNTSSPIPSAVYSNPTSIGFQNTSHFNVESTEFGQPPSSLGSAEPMLISSGVTNSVDSTKEALKKLTEVLSEEDDIGDYLGTYSSQVQNQNNLVFQNYGTEIPQYNPEYNKLERCYGGYVGNQDHFNNLMLAQTDSGDSASQFWKDMFNEFNTSEALGTEVQITPHPSENLLPQVEEDFDWDYNTETMQSPLMFPEVPNAFEVPANPSALEAYDGKNDAFNGLTSGQGQFYMPPPAQDVNQTAAAQNPKFTFQDVSPQWGYANESTKVIIVGSFREDPTESTWKCMFGNSEVPIQIIKEGVIRCVAPPCPPGKVTLCITSGNHISCSDIREFEYRAKTSISASSTKCPAEMLLLVRFAQMLLSAHQSEKANNQNAGIDDNLSRNLKSDDHDRDNDDVWGPVIEAILNGSATSSSTADWLLQKLLKDKLNSWLSSRSKAKEEGESCSLSKKEQCIIHMVAGLGFEWALSPILSHGVNVNFRDINGWTALHWAARFGREKIAAALIASGASPGAVTDPNSKDLIGKTAAFIAYFHGHKGLAGYLSELALTNHLSSLTLEETENSKGWAQLQAECMVSSVAESTLPDHEDPLLLKDSLEAVRNAAQAAARIQAAFRAHSFRMRQKREAAMAECGILHGDIQALSAISKLTFKNSQDYHSAALSIQKNYRSWKGRKDFLALRKKVIMIQAHVRGYQVRKQYKAVCWAVGVIDKVVLRWRRKGAGLHRLRQDGESTDESEDEQNRKVFRKEKVDGAVNAALSRVLSMVRSHEARHQYHRMLHKYYQNKQKGLGIKTSEMEESFDLDAFLDLSEFDTQDYDLFLP